MRIAALYDIHGDLPALDAVLAEIDADLVVVGGDVVSGPMPAQTLERLRALDLPLRWVMGNADRLVAAGDREHPDDARALDALDEEQVAFLRTFEPAVSVDGALFCHGSPRSDTERITPRTPRDRLREMFAEVEERLVVGGHTHRQFALEVDGRRYVNAGRVAVDRCWPLVDGGAPAPRRAGSG